MCAFVVKIIRSTNSYYLRAIACRLCVSPSKSDQTDFILPPYLITFGARQIEVALVGRRGHGVRDDVPFEVGRVDHVHNSRGRLVLVDTDSGR